MKRNSDQIEKRAAWLAGTAAFLFCLVLQLIMNRAVTTVRSLPDEMGAIYLAAQKAGYDWSYVMVHSNRYYGSIMFPLLYPWFKAVKNPYQLYQFLLGTGTFLRSLPAFYAADLLRRRSREKDGLVVFALSALSVLITPTRSVNIDNEPALIFLCWTVFYLLSILPDCGTAADRSSNRGGRKGKRAVPGRQILLSALLGGVCGFSLLAHTRAVIFLMTAAVALVWYRLEKGRWPMHLPAFAAGTALSMLVSTGIIRHWKNTLYRAAARTSDGEHLMNTGESLAKGMLRGVGKSSGQYGLLSVLDLLSGNLFVIFVVSGGVILAGMILALLIGARKIRTLIRSFAPLSSGGQPGPDREDPSDTFYMLLYGFAGIAGIILGICLTWTGAAIRVHTDGAGVSHGHFYLRYYGMYFGPFFMALVLTLKKERRLLRRASVTAGVFAATVLTGILSFVESRYSFLQISIEKAKDSDAFYNFAPFSFSFRAFPDQIQDGGYYLKNLLVAAVVFCILYFAAARRRRRTACLLLLTVLLYQHIYIVWYWDHPITAKDHFASSSDGIYRLWQEHEDLFQSGDTLYQMEESVAKYCTQFAMKELKVVTELPPEGVENAMILIAETGMIDKNGIDPGVYRMLAIDENEILLVRGKDFLDRFARAGLELTDCPAADDTGE